MDKNLIYLNEVKAQRQIDLIAEKFKGKKSCYIWGR